MEFLIFIVSFILFVSFSSFIIAVSYQYLYKCLGSPFFYIKNGKTQAMNNKGMILSWLGAKICNFFNNIEHDVYQDIKEDVEKKYFDSEEYKKDYQFFIENNPNFELSDKTLSIIREKLINNAIQRNYEESNHLNFAKPLGLCALCTLPWITLIYLIIIAITILMFNGTLHFGLFIIMQFMIMVTSNFINSLLHRE